MEASRKATGKMVGFCGVGTWRDHPDLEIGWWLVRRHWVCGLAMEAARSALQDVFERVKLDRVISVAMRSNAASTRIMEKIGLQFELEFEDEGVRLVQYAMDLARYLMRYRRRS